MARRTGSRRVLRLVLGAFSCRASILLVVSSAPWDGSGVARRGACVPRRRSNFERAEGGRMLDGNTHAGDEHAWGCVSRLGSMLCSALLPQSRGSGPGPSFARSTPPVQWRRGGEERENDNNAGWKHNTTRGEIGSKAALRSALSRSRRNAHASVALSQAGAFHARSPHTITQHAQWYHAHATRRWKASIEACKAKSATGSFSAMRAAAGSPLLQECLPCSCACSSR